MSELSLLELAREKQTPLTISKALELFNELSGMFGFPQMDTSATRHAKAVMDMCGTVEIMDWLIDAITKGCPRYPMPVEMRRMLCQHFPPADGLNDLSFTDGGADMSSLLNGRGGR